MTQITLIEINAWLDTAAGAGKTTAEAVAFLTAQKAEVAALLNPPVEFDKAAHVARLRIERDEWQASTGHPPERVTQAIARLDAEIANYE